MQTIVQEPDFAAWSCDTLLWVDNKVPQLHITNSELLDYENYCVYLLQTSSH